MMKSCFTKRRSCLVLVVLLVSCNCLCTVASANPVNPVASLSATSGLIGSYGGEKRVSVFNAEKNTTYCPNSWVTLRTVNKQVVMTVAPNTNREVRKTTVTIYTDTVTLKYTLTQAN